jgi:ubiquinone/menaquinone biosynthesis C-methylase UbiE
LTERAAGSWPKSSSRFFHPTILPALHYFFWSKKLNIHFGYYRFGRSLRLEAMLAAMNQLIARSLQLSSAPDAILDMGCGFGTTAQDISQSFPNIKITGVNLLPSQIELAKQRSAPGSVQFMEADFQAIPLPGAFFQAAYALESACYSNDENKAGLVSEVARLLQPGGRFVVVDGFRKHGRKLPGWVDFLYQENLRTWGMRSLATIGGFCEALTQYGFEEVRKKDISWNMLPSLLHVPFVVGRLCFANLKEKDAGRSWYIRALLLTLALVPFKRHFAYYLVTCVKSSVKSQF